MPANPLLEPFELFVQIVSAIVMLEMFLYIWNFRNIRIAREHSAKLFENYATFRRGILFVFIGISLHFSGDLFIPVSAPASLILYTLGFTFIAGGLFAHLLVLYGKAAKRRKRK